MSCSPNTASRPRGATSAKMRRPGCASRRVRRVRPRACYTHRSNYLHTLRALQADAIALTDRDVVLAAVPMFHANGWGLPFAVPAVGAKLVLPGRHADGASLVRLLREEKVTVAIGVHTLWLGV